ncbi:MAG: polymer-forming cytoskeletal protein [Myxococcales bacterium]|jgi:cytoskeletal protein CcmA (bactofilin family)|nr:polymer-forming cytoskeletal protein [Myxococcales bacterium]
MVNPAKTEVPTQAAVIAEATCVKGSVRGAADLVVLGRVEGQIRLDKGLFVQATGVVKADVVAESVIVQGVLVGDVIATQSVQITAEGRVVGNVSAPRFSMAEGALYRGHVETDEAVLQNLAARHGQQASEAQPPARLTFQRTAPAPAAPVPMAPARPMASSFSSSFPRSGGTPPAPPPAPTKLSFKPVEAKPRLSFSQPPAPPPPPPPFQTMLMIEEGMEEIPGDDDLTPRPALIGKRRGALKRKKP